MSFPVFDLHCDTALALLGKQCDSFGSLLQNECHIDLNRAKSLPAYAQVFACFTTPQMEQWYQKSPTLIFELELATIMREVEKNSHLISLCYSAQDIQRNREKGKMSAILSIEGPAGFGYDPALLEDLHKIGFRITTLGWNEHNPLTGSHITGEGLTDLGAEYVREAQRLGMLIDVSHISDQGFWDIMDITQGPVVATHSNSRAVHSASRNLTDEMFLAICKSGGVAALNLYRDFIGQNNDLEAAVAHVLHFLELDPGGKHIALGGDLDGCDKLLIGFDGVQDYPYLAQKMLEMGIPAETVENIFWNNAFGVIQNAVRNNKK